MKDSIKIKICGLRELANIQAIAQPPAVPDYVGFIFYKKSKRFVGEDFKLKTSPYLPKTIHRVGVFVNSSLLYIQNKIKHYQLSHVQLHGDESPAFCQMIKKTGVQIIKAFAIDNDFDFSFLAKYKQYVHYFLFDTKTKHYGGSGRTFNWQLLDNYDQAVPFFISGGIGLENITNVLISAKQKNWNIHAIDANSRLEIAPALKDVAKVKQFVAEVRTKNLF